MSLSPFGLVGAVASLTLCGAAFRLGERPERLAASSLLAGLVMVPLIQDRGAWIDPNYRLALIDGSIFGLLAWLTSTTQRKWVLYATAFQLLSILADLLHLLDPRVGGRAYLTVAFGLGYAVEVALLWGSLQVAVDRAARLRAIAARRAARTVAYFGDPRAAIEATDRALANGPPSERKEARAVLAKLAAGRKPGV